MRVYEQHFKVPRIEGQRDLLGFFRDHTKSVLPPDHCPVRFAIVKTDNVHYHCEAAVATGLTESQADKLTCIFKLSRRNTENATSFNAVVLIPTGINCEIGGHAGDAGPVIRLLASLCDKLITHPNAVNGSDINELPPNGLYVEGSVIDRLLLGNIGLEPVRSNRVLLVMDHHPVQSFHDATLNSLNAARATYGLDCPKVVVTSQNVRLQTTVSPSGRATGTVENIESMLSVVEREHGTFDALALAGMIDSPKDCYADYFSMEGEMANPWGGVEAIYTHTLSLLIGLPTAHAPMLRTKEISEAEQGIVDPRMAAELISRTFLQSVLIGLQQSPRIVHVEHGGSSKSALTACDISCIVIPGGILGLPVLAALDQGITVIAVRDNRNLMNNDLAHLPWSPGKYIEVNSYLEAAGVMASLKAGVSLESVRRPLKRVQVERQ